MVFHKCILFTDKIGFKVPQSVFEDTDLAVYTLYRLKCMVEIPGYATTTAFKANVMNLAPHSGTCGITLNSVTLNDGDTGKTEYFV